jgi:hypothetical protein
MRLATYNNILLINLFTAMAYAITFSHPASNRLSRKAPQNRRETLNDRLYSPFKLHASDKRARRSGAVHAGGPTHRLSKRMAGGTIAIIVAAVIIGCLMVAGILIFGRKS